MQLSRSVFPAVFNVCLKPYTGDVVCMHCKSYRKKILYSLYHFSILCGSLCKICCKIVSFIVVNQCMMTVHVFIIRRALLVVVHVDQLVVLA